MTYQDVVLKLRKVYENADARAIFEHVAIQVNIEGEAKGACYIEIAERAICVEPYDYYDRDGILTASGETLVALADGKLKLKDALKDGSLRYDGNQEKFELLQKIKMKKKRK